MHLLVPFAAPLSPIGQEALRALSLPNLAALVGHAAPERDDGDALSFTPPHERALAAAIGLAGADGTLPWAAHHAALDGRDAGDLAWGEVTPVHWHVGTDQVTLMDPQALALEEAESRALLDAVHDLFDGEGFVLVYGAPLRWYLAHESLAQRRTASLDRVIGRNIDTWLPRDADARLLRRLQNEAQMRWHEHPVNAAREARGESAVNSFWLSGCGHHQAVTSASDLVVDEQLRASALAEDWHGWQTAWHALDAGPLADLLRQQREGQAVRLTLCGERASARWTLEPPGILQRALGRWRTTDPRTLLETL